MKQEKHIVSFLGRCHLDHARKSGIEISSSHDESHLGPVAELTQLVGAIYDYPEREQLLAFIAGWYHDLVRSPSEDPNLGDEDDSSQEASYILEQLTSRNILNTTEVERNAIGFAIQHHSTAPDWMSEREPKNLAEKIQMALFVADKLEANGIKVLARRAAFVAGERLQKPDLQQFGFTSDAGEMTYDDERKVVLIESFLRLAFINPQHIYPRVLQPLVEPMYQLQRDFVTRLMASLHMRVEDVAELVLSRKNDRGQNILSFRQQKLKLETIPDSVDTLTKMFTNLTGIKDNDDEEDRHEEAFSAWELVAFFSTNHQQPMDELIRSWQPESERAQKWHEMMLNYIDGTWLEEKEKEIRLKTLIINHTHHNEALMPMQMGPACRVPEYAYPYWGLDSVGEKTVVDLYAAEWAGGNQYQLGLVSQASEQAGFGNYPALLRKKTAEVVSALVEEKFGDGELIILDLGAGPGLSALTTYNSLPDSVKQRTTIYLLDPSKASLQEAGGVLEQNGIRHRLLHGVDLDLTEHIPRESIDILTGVASVHHHAHIPFDIYHTMLKPGGIAVFADWHHSLWEHPEQVRQFLEDFNWPLKKEGLRHWGEVYPTANNPVEEPSNPLDKRANNQITRFWLSYAEMMAQTGTFGVNAIWPLEGHRPVKEYVTGMEKVGFSIDTSWINKIIQQKILNNNPHQLLSDSSLLMLTVGEKI